MATALGEHRPDATVETILPGLLDALRRPLADADRLTPDECRQLERRDWLRGRQLRAPLGGRAEGIAADGALLIRTDDGTTAVRAGHVELAGGSFTR
jgi:biotin-(acetyl-CoA carboxylase) ligase